MEEGRPEWTEKLREEEHRDSKKKKKKNGKRWRHSKEGKGNKRKKHTHKTKPPQIKINKIEKQMNPRKEIGEETKTLSSLYCPSWGGGVKAPGLVGVRGWTPGLWVVFCTVLQWCSAPPGGPATQL